jgi:cytochrome c biogenesis protein CcmG/thiol:disulfide interchange protein DsbE
MAKGDPIGDAIRLLERPAQPPADFADALFARLLEELREKTEPGTERAERGPARPEAGRGRPPWLGRTWLMAAAAVVTIAAVVASLLVVPRPQNALAIVRDAQERLSSMPAFQATFVYNLNPEGASPPAPDVPQGATATLRISHDPVAGYRQEILEEVPPFPGSQTAGAGSFIVWHDGQAGTYSSHANTWVTYRTEPGFEPLRDFAWDTPYPNWEGICARAGSEVLPDQVVAGRQARHIRCGDELAGFWELWIDRETGLVLKEVGALGADDFHPFATTPKGGFTVSSIQYGPAFPSGTFSLTPPAGAFDVNGTATPPPPFEATYTVQRSLGPIQQETFHVWYRDDQAFRRDVVSVEPSHQDGGAGSFWVWDGSHLGSYEAVSNIYDPNASDPGAANPRLDLDPTYKHGWSIAAGSEVAWTTFAQTACPSPVHDVVAGRDAVHYTCSSSSNGTVDLWLDVESGLILKQVARYAPTSADQPGIEIDIDVASMQVDPVFPPGTFTFTPPPGAVSAEQAANDAYRDTSLRPDQEAPEWSGPLLSGGTLELAGLRGKPVLVLYFSDWCLPEKEPACLDLPQFQQAFDAWKDRVSFVWVDWNGTADGAQKVVELNHYTVPVVLDPKGGIGKAWGVQAFPLWVLLDAQGNVVDVRIKPQTVDQLNEMLSQVEGGTSPSPTASA